MVHDVINSKKAKEIFRVKEARAGRFMMLAEQYFSAESLTARSTRLYQNMKFAPPA